MTNEQNTYTSHHHNGFNNQQPYVYGPVPRPPLPAEEKPAQEHKESKPSLSNLFLAGALALTVGVLGTNLIQNHVKPDVSIQQVVSDPGALKEISTGTVNWVDTINKVSDSVVAISVEGPGKEGTGSGVIFDVQGYILTNDHVVTGSNKITVVLKNGTIHSAQIVGTDPSTDLAVLKLDKAPEGLNSAVFADSDKVVVGENVLALGNPLGLSQTATTGIVSALDRPVTTSSSDQSNFVATNAIQIDAAINPGNSGGPLFNAKGEVIGITSSIATVSSYSSGSIGIGFAIPSNQATSISKQLVKEGKVTHALLGVTSTLNIATVGENSRYGAQLESVADNSAAAKAGLKPGDIIVAVEDTVISGPESLTALVREHSPNDTIKVMYVRDGKSGTLEVTLDAREVEPEIETDKEPKNQKLDEDFMKKLEEFFNQR